jgi:23S rRNA (uridine2552-2'-O)-methyltransferase
LVENSRLKTRVKTAKRRKISSTRWLQRQLNDPFVKAAKDEGYRSRAAYKLIQINEKFEIIKPGYNVIDLGSTPGGWTQVAVDIVNSNKKTGTVIACDINEMEPVTGSVFFQADFLDPETATMIIDEMQGKADLVMSDMAAQSSGHKQVDHIRIITLCEEAFYFAKDVLKPGGNFIAKILQGGATNELLADLKKSFKKVQHHKPDASRKDSNEIYIVALDFKGS